MDRTVGGDGGGSERIRILDEWRKRGEAWGAGAPAVFSESVCTNASADATSVSDIVGNVSSGRSTGQRGTVACRHMERNGNRGALTYELAMPEHTNV
jgi:hypothetical protein